MDDVFIGMIQAFGFNFEPRNWAFCDGQLIAISENPTLYSLLSTYYGGDGRTNFALPDLRGRVIMGMGDGPGTSPRSIGQQYGFETTTLGVSQLPNHTHGSSMSGASVTVKASTQTGDSSAPSSRGNKTVLSGLSAGTMYSANTPDIDLNVGGGAVSGSVTIDNAGAGQAFNNMQPYTVVNMCISLMGTYPSRT